MSDEHDTVPLSEHLEATTSMERQIAELEADLSALKHAHDQLRNDRWWATYNATLTGLHAYSADGTSYTIEGAHKRAVKAADEAHGKLVQP